MTIHKSQGITADRVVVIVNHPEFIKGLSYVAASRVRTLDCLLIQEPIDFDKMCKRKGGDTANARAADTEARWNQLLDR